MVTQLQEELASVCQQQTQLLNLRMLKEIDADTFASKNRNLRDRTARFQLEIEAFERGRHEIIGTAVKAFEFSQSLREKWFDAGYAANVESSKSAV